MKYAAFIFLIFAWALNAEVQISDTLSVDGYAITSDKSPKKRMKPKRRNALHGQVRHLSKSDYFQRPMKQIFRTLRFH